MTSQTVAQGRCFVGLRSFILRRFFALFFVGFGFFAAGCTSTPSKLSPDGTYTLTADDNKLNCSQIRGRMKLRLMQIRATRNSQKSTALSRNMHGASSSIFGGTNHGVNPDQQYAQDVAILRAYNSQLAAKKCETFDLDKELASKQKSSMLPAPLHWQTV